VQQISVCVTTFNESTRANFRWVRECILPACTHPLVASIVLVNDGTPDVDGLRDAVRDMPKVSVVQNPVNLGVFGNKLTAVAASPTPWCLLADSDNIFERDFFDRLSELPTWDERTMYSASLAAPCFDYRAFIGRWGLQDFPRFAKHCKTVPQGKGVSMAWCLWNTCNVFCHRDTVVETFSHVPKERFDLWQPNYFGLDKETRKQHAWRRVYDAQDSFFINKLWWFSENTLEVVDGLTYQHRVDETIKSNYATSPVDKEMLAPLYYLELMEAAAGRDVPLYRVATRSGNAFGYRDVTTPGRAVCVNRDIRIPISESCVASR